MNITVNAKQLQAAITAAMSIREPILITGQPGIGKTDIIKQATEQAGYDLLISHPVVSDPTDAKGLPFCVTDQDGQPQATFLPYGDMRQAIDAPRPLVWFLDDLGQASPAVQASFMQLLLSRRINGHELPEHVVFIAATNRRQDRAGVSGILEPVKSRFATILELVADVDSWSTWAINAGISTEVIAFMRFRPGLLSDFNPSADMEQSPCPRTWAKLDKFLQAGIDDTLLFPVAAGAVGEGAAGEFIAFRQIFQQLPNPDIVLMQPDKFDVPTDPATIYALCGAIARKASPDNFNRVVQVADRLTQEFGVLLITDCLNYCHEVAQTRAFIDWSAKNADVLI